MTITKKRISRVFPLTKAILATAWEIGKGLAQSFFPPQYAKKYGYSYMYKNSYGNSLRYLEKRGLVRKTDSRIFYLTTRGKKEAFWAFINGETRIFKNKISKWDNRWRIVFFDFPEKKRRYRDNLRIILRTIGFKEFQKSVWVYPYKVPSFLKDFLFEEQIKQYTRFITTEEIEYDKDLKRMFGLLKK